MVEYRLGRYVCEDQICNLGKTVDGRPGTCENRCVRAPGAEEHFAKDVIVWILMIISMLRSCCIGGTNSDQGDRKSVV